MNSATTESIKNINFFNFFSQETLKKIEQRASITHHPKGNLLFVNEDQADHFYIVKSGWIKLYRETIDGTQSIIDILTTNQLFGETSIFQDDTYPYTAEATEDSVVLSLPLDLLKSEIEHNTKLAMTMMSSMARYRKQQDQEIENRTLKNAPQRIGCFLLRLTEQQENKTVSIRLPYDKTLVASRLGMQPETFSRALNKLKQEIQMTVQGRDIIINDVQELVHYTCTACSSEYPCNDLH